MKGDVSKRLLFGSFSQSRTFLFNFVRCPCNVLTLCHRNQYIVTHLLTNI